MLAGSQSINQSIYDSLVYIHLQAVGVGSEAIGSMCRSIAAWAEDVGKPKLSAEADDIQPIIDSIQVSLLPLLLLLLLLLLLDIQQLLLSPVIVAAFDQAK